MIGLDAGSTTLKAVAVDAHDALVTSVYRKAAGNPLQDAKAALGDLAQQLGERAGEICALGVTGYAADLLGPVLGADATPVETLAHARAARHFVPDADVVCDVGGQDIKVLTLDRETGSVLTFRLSHQCAAGNGALLEATASELGVPLEQLAAVTLSARRAPEFSVGCAVFLDTERVTAQRDGYGPAEVLAGVTAVLPRNIWQTVAAETRLPSLGKVFVLSGGVQRNAAAVKAQLDYLKEHHPKAKVVIDPHPGEAGALGAAFVAREAVGEGRSRFIGFEQVATATWLTRSDETTRCHVCSAACARTVVVAGGPGAGPLRLVTGQGCERGADLERVGRARRADAARSRVELSPVDPKGEYTGSALHSAPGGAGAIATNAERRPSERGPVERGPVERGPSERGPSERGPSERGPSERGPAERGPAERGPAERGPSERAPSERGPVERGTAEPRSADPILRPARPGADDLECDDLIRRAFEASSAAAAERIGGASAEAPCAAPARPRGSAALGQNLLKVEASRLFARSRRVRVVSQAGRHLRIALPRVLAMYRAAPLFTHYFEALGVPRSAIVTGEATSEELWRRTAGRGTVDACYPAKVAQAHVADLLARHAAEPFDALFFPVLTHAATPVTGCADTAACPVVAGTPLVTRAAFGVGPDDRFPGGPRLVTPTIKLTDPIQLSASVCASMRELLPSLTPAEHDAALAEGLAAQREFEERLERDGQKVLREAASAQRCAVVVLGRPYHADPGIHHELGAELAALGRSTMSVRALPRHAGLCGETHELRDEAPFLTNSGDGEKLAGARFVVLHNYLVAIEISSFKCGQDASLYGAVADISRSGNKPFLALHDLDETRPVASLRLRLRTFLDAVERWERRVATLERRPA